MHNNFYYLRQLTPALEQRIGNAVISECFSQNKDELVIRFEAGSDAFHIRASLSPALSCLSFPGNFHRARKNSVDLFPSIVGARVARLRQFENERSFAIVLADDQTLLFKMHGTRTNIVLFQAARVAEIFRKNMLADHEIDLDELDRAIDWSHEYFMAHIQDLRTTYFTFGKVVWQYLAGKGFGVLTAEDKWLAIQSLLKRLSDPHFYLTIVQSRPVLSLVETGDVIKVLDDPLLAANEFFHYYTQQHVFLREKGRLMGILKSKLDAGESYVQKNSARLQEVKRDDHYRVWADLLMANLHNISPGSGHVVLENFYDQQHVTVKLRKDLSPQKTAEVYYRKAKNQHIEIERLEQSIRVKQEEMKSLRSVFAEAEMAADIATVKAIESALFDRGAEKSERVHLPYYEFDFQGYKILVGKNAQANDVLTLKHSYKEDLWLHAKDVSGSHVLIKHQAGKNFPKDVIEYAASLAAFNSKRRTESLCPVIVTPKKYVRKRKGDPAGMVVVEKEDVILVPPAKPDQSV